MWQDYAETSTPTDRYNDRQTNQTDQTTNQPKDGHEGSQGSYTSEI